MRPASEYLEVLISLLAVANPLAIAPVFLAMTGHFDTSRRIRNATMAALTITVTGILAIYVGEALFKAFSIGIPSFRVAGGLCILLTAIQMVRQGVKPPEGQEAVETDVGIVPIGIPLICGPGTISAVIIQSHEFESAVDNMILAWCVVGLALVSWVSLAGAQFVSRLLGDTGMDVMTRIFGLILAALAFEFISSGLLELFPGLA